MSIAALIFAGSMAFAQTAVNTVTISGSVVDDTGTPIAGASVHYNNAPATAKDAAGRVHLAEPLVSSHVLTGKDGTFSITGVPAGFYSLCATGVSPTHLRSCDWGGGSAHVSVSSGTASVRLQVPNGVLLTFQVTDAHGQVQDFPTATAANGPATSAAWNFRIFVHDGGAFMAAAAPVSAAGNVRQYAVAVPKTSSLRLLLDTSLKVMDQSSSAIPARALSGSIAINGQPMTVKLTVP
jgi:hypothetical protein